MPKRLPKILIVDDEPNMLHMLSEVLQQDGFDPSCAESAQRALDMVSKESFDFILSDVRMPGMDGVQLLEQLRASGIDTMVILMSAYGTIDLALEAIRKGAYDYIAKPFKTDEVVLTLRKAAERERLRKEVVQLRKRLRDCEPSSEIVAHSEALKNILSTARQVASFESSVLITGESGTGKELLAREIHNRSPRSQGSFVGINCGAIPRHLLESELFGYVRGAFTGADKDKTGIFEEAEGGTLFLDEIAAMDPTLQVKILRTLDTGEIRRLGESRARRTSVRVLAATNEDLSAAMETGSFRRDLYFRLNVVHLHIPPLRDRKTDIPPLVEHFVSTLNKKMGLKIQHITREAKDALLAYEWKGNVRELQNVLERAMILAPGEAISLEGFPDDIRSAGTRVRDFGGDEETISLKKASKDLERVLITKALNRCGGNRSRAAGLLEISYPSLLSKIKEHGLT
ncbi:MAG: sigma-54 dependent transcriptional regulator [Desulfomonilaceae bacterium]|nr:sigma-54 dependent transcriptional regulator [Desulfomonilaceae bacterium]